MLRDVALDKAKQAVSSRSSSYGSPEENFTRIANLWNAHYENSLDCTDCAEYFNASDVAIMLGLVKVARLESNPNHADSWVDWAGYAACGAEVSQAEVPKVAESQFGFTVGERVNLRGFREGSNPGTVIGFHCQYVLVGWDAYLASPCSYFPRELRHGI